MLDFGIEFGLDLRLAHLANRRLFFVQLQRRRRTRERFFGITTQRRISERRLGIDRSGIAVRHQRAPAREGAEVMARGLREAAEELMATAPPEPPAT